MQRTLVFGTFDGVHDGHRAMLRQAKTVGDTASCQLIVAVAPDSVVGVLKGAPPHHNQAERIALIKHEHIADEVVLADESIGSWKILKKVRPQCIALGYDQQELKSHLEAHLEGAYPDVETASGEWIKNPKKPRIVMLSAYKPDTLHSSKIKTKRSSQFFHD
jgi:cytidyltransferase-like protein